MPDFVIYGALVLLAILAALIGLVIWIARDVNQEDADAAAARKGEQSVEMWGRK